jgi:hypothetical protein
MASKPRIYIDACYYIDVAKGKDAVAAENHGFETHLPFVETLFLAALNGDVEIVASTLLIAECQHAGDSTNIPETTKETFRRLLTSGQGVILIAPDVFIAERARDLLWMDYIRCGGASDAVHVATALETKCDEFLTYNTHKGPGKPETAAKLAKLGLRVITATQTTVLPDKYTSPLLGPGAPTN